MSLRKGVSLKNIVADASRFNLTTLTATPAALSGYNASSAKFGGAGPLARQNASRAHSLDNPAVSRALTLVAALSFASSAVAGFVIGYLILRR